MASNGNFNLNINAKNNTASGVQSAIKELKRLEAVQNNLRKAALANLQAGGSTNSKSYLKNIQQINSLQSRINSIRPQSVTGLQKAFTGLKNSISGVWTVFKSIPVVGIFATAGIAAVFKLVSSWQQFNSQLLISSRFFNEAPRKIEVFRNRVALAGGDPEAAERGAADLQNQIYLKNTAEGQPLQQLLSRMGVKSEANGKDRDATDVQDDVVEALRKQRQRDPSISGSYIADVLARVGAGSRVNETSLSDADATRNKKRAAELAVSDKNRVQQSQEVTSNLAYFSIAIENTKNAFLNMLGPSIAALTNGLVVSGGAFLEFAKTTLPNAITWLTNLLPKNKEDWKKLWTTIKTDFSSFSTSLGKLAGGISSVADFIDDITHPGKRAHSYTVPNLDDPSDTQTAALFDDHTQGPGGLLNRAGIEKLNHPDAPGIGNRIESWFKGAPDKNERQMEQMLKSMGYPPNVIAAIMANANGESGFDPKAEGDLDASGKPTSFGLFQFHADRAKAYKEKYGHLPSEGSMGEQIREMILQLDRTGTLGRMIDAPSPEKSSEIMTRESLRPANVDQVAAARGNYAVTEAQRLKGSVSVDIRLSGQGSAGAKVTASSSGIASTPKVAQPSVLPQ